MLEIDFPDLAERLKKGEYAAVSAVLGVEVDGGSRKTLERFADLGNYRGTLGLPRLLAIIYRAARDPLGYVYERVETPDWKLHCLAARRDGHIVLGAHQGLRASLPRAWPQLEGWSRKLEKNKSLVHEWAGDPKRLRLRLAKVEVASHSADAALDQLRQAVLAQPDELTPRLVLADALNERGQIRGEFIRLQIEREKVFTPQLEERLKALFQSGAKSFAGEAAPWATKLYDFRRGFVDTVTMTIDAFAKHGERVFTSEPVRRLCVKNTKFTEKELRRLAESPALRHVRLLALKQTNPTVARLPLSSLGSSPHFEKLEELELDSCGHSFEDWERLFSTLRAPALKRLRFHYNHTSAGIFRGLAANATLKSLRCLDEYPFDAVDEKPYAKELKAFATAFPALEDLRLAGRRFDDGCIAPFFEAGTQLKWLSLNGAPVTNALARKAATSTVLETFHVHNSEVRLGGAKALLEVKTLRRLMIGCFDDGIWPDADVNELARLVLANPRLEGVAIPRNQVLDESLKAQLRERFGELT